MCILAPFFKLRNKKRLDRCGEAVWNLCCLEYFVNREEIKRGSPSHLLVLIGQSFPHKVYNSQNVQTVSSLSSCKNYACVWAPPRSPDMVL